MGTLLPFRATLPGVSSTNEGRDVGLANASGIICPYLLQKSKNSKSGTEMQHDRDRVAAIMREKQKKGKEMNICSPHFP